MVIGQEISAISENIKDRTFLAEYGTFDSAWFSRLAWSDESQLNMSCMMFQTGVFGNLVRNI